MSLLQGASGKTRGHRHMPESGISQLVTETYLFIYLFIWIGRWSNSGVVPGVAVHFPSLESSNSAGWALSNLILP